MRGKIKHSGNEKRTEKGKRNKKKCVQEVKRGRQLFAFIDVVALILPLLR